MELEESDKGSSMDENELDEYELNAVPLNTRKATESRMKKFREWCQKRNYEIDYFNITPANLAIILRKFYAEVKHADGKTALSPSSLISVRSAIHRFITSAPYSRSFSIVHGPEFIPANRMFKSRLRSYYQDGNSKPRHKPVFENSDMAKLSNYFVTWRTNPQVLLDATWFTLCYYFGRRGRESWATMEKDFFVQKYDDNRIPYVTTAKTESTKNHQGGVKQSEQDYSDVRMYGPGVEIFNYYIQKSNPDISRLFCYPVKGVVNENTPTFFQKRPLGKTPLGKIMQSISQRAGLTTNFTCHSVRASMITHLFRSGVPTEQIAKITKHKSVSSLDHYVSDLSTDQKVNCCKLLTSKFQPPVKFPEENIAKTEIKLENTGQQDIKVENTGQQEIKVENTGQQEEITGTKGEIKVEQNEESSEEQEKVSYKSLGRTFSTNSFHNCNFVFN